jgi:Thioredoxin-like
MKSLALVALAILPGIACGEIPSDYLPLVVEAPFSLSERVFDLTQAIAQARSHNKPLFIYVGAADCGPCREYKSFLVKNRTDLQAAFSRVTVVDVRTWLKGPPIKFRVAQDLYSFADFKVLTGDKNIPLVYPYHWLLSPDLRQIRQLPLGSAGYMSVETHTALLQLP